MYVSFEGVQYSQVTVHTVVRLASCSTKSASPLEAGLRAPDTSQQPRDPPHGTPQFSSPQAVEPGFSSLSLTKKKIAKTTVSDTDMKRQLYNTTHCLIQKVI